MSGKGGWVGEGIPLPVQRDVGKSQKFPLGEEQEGGGRGDTHVGVAVAQDLVQDVAELPAEDGTAGQGQPDGVGPEGEGSLLVVGAQDDPFQGSQGQLDTHRAGDRLGWGCSCSTFIEKGTLSAP